MPDKVQITAAQYEIEAQKEYINALNKKIADLGLKYHVVTYGCQMNVHDSENLAGFLNEFGYEYTENQHDADLIIFNTCCVRENAELKVYGNIGSLKPYKQSNPDLIIVVCGCMMQQPEVSEYIKDKFPFVDLIFGTHNLYRFPSLLWEAISSNHTVVEVLETQDDIVEHIPIKRSAGVNAWVTIMYGCNNFCNYCIVPYVRGRERSRQPSEIIGEIKQLVDIGYKEITLLGQNVNSYGKDLNDNYTFSNLLRDIDTETEIERIRFMTSHPKDLSQDAIDAIRDCAKVCEHLHLPVQSGSSKVLKEMNRKYTKQDYVDLVDRIREAVPNIALTTDIIVGFPGETEEDFQETLDLVDKIRFDSAYTFIYSQRTGTPAAKRNDQIREEVKKERLNRLMALQDKISKEKNMEYKDKVVEVLVEGPSKNNEDVLTGRTRTNKIVNFKGTKSSQGKLLNVKVIETHSWSLDGELY